MKPPSQRTLARMMSVLTSAAQLPTFSRFLYENDFPDWFLTQAASFYEFNWDRILPDLRSGRFFTATNSYFELPSWNITGEYLTDREARALGEHFIEMLAALATTLPHGDSIANALQLDGLSVDVQKLRLIPLDGPVSAKEEETALSALVNRTGITDASTILKHMADADGLYLDEKYHPSLNESRNLVQSLIDNIGGDTHKSGVHSAGFPGGTANRIEYLRTVSFLTADEMAALKSAWGALSAGSHPGVPEREEARIGLILALEFSQLLLLKFEDWKCCGYKRFSR